MQSEKMKTAQHAVFYDFVNFRISARKNNAAYTCLLHFSVAFRTLVLLQYRGLNLLTYCTISAFIAFYYNTQNNLSPYQKFLDRPLQVGQTICTLYTSLRSKSLLTSYIDSRD